MIARDDIVIVGTSVGGVKVAKALRSAGVSRPITLVGAESDWPYDKPPLSKQLLVGSWGIARIALLTPAQASELSLEVRLGAAATAIDLAERTITLADGTVLGFGTCVIATGASARPSPWAPRRGVHVLRTLRDALAIRDALRDGGPLAVVGAGFVGAEVASSARALGLAVTVIDPLQVPMAALVASDPGRMFTELAARRGVDLRLGVSVETIDDHAGKLRLWLSDGGLVIASSVVVGIGATPNTSWLEGAGLDIEDGVLCDAWGRALGTENVYAVGDVARWAHPTSPRGVRVEHWTNALDHAACVAATIADPSQPRAHTAIPYVWTDQHDSRFQIVGRPALGVHRAPLGDLASEQPRGAVLYSDAGGRLVGALVVNWPRTLVTLRRALADGVDGEAALSALAPSA